MEQTNVKVDPEESLNIEEHIKPMILKALNKACCQRGASRLLGINVRTLRLWMLQYNIHRISKNKYGSEDKNTTFKPMSAAV